MKRSISQHAALGFFLVLLLQLLFAAFLRPSWFSTSFHIAPYWKTLSRAPPFRSSANRLLSTWSAPVDLRIVDRQADAAGEAELWPILSVVPVWGPNTSELIMIGPYSDVAGNETRAGSHICEYSDGTITSIKKFNNLEYYASATVWVCPMPEHLNERFFASKSPDVQTCVVASLKTSSGVQIGSAQGCHHPGVLPARNEPYETAICTGSRLVSVENNTLNSAHVVLAEFLQYHIRHGIDQIVVYLMQGPNYDHEMRLLRPFAESGHVTIVAMSPQISDIPGAVYDLHVVGSEKNSSVGCQHTIMNDCVNRMKYRARWVGLLDVDEFIFAEDWYTGKSPPHNPSAVNPYFKSAKEDWDAVTVPQKRFRKNPGVLHGPYLRVNERELEWPGVFGKSFVRPEQVRVHWVHAPSRCLRGSCVNERLPGMMYYHLRFDPEGEIPDSHFPAKTMISDGIMLAEAEAVFEESCEMLSRAGFDCRNKSSLLPPGKLKS
jgi:hypothetical protein